MAAKQPAMSPSDLPVSEVLDRVTGPRRAEADELLALHREVSGARISPARIGASQISWLGDR